MIVVCLECDVSHLLKDLGTKIKLKTNKTDSYENITFTIICQDTKLLETDELMKQEIDMYISLHDNANMLTNATHKSC